MFKLISHCLALLIVVSIDAAAQWRDPVGSYGKRIAARDAAWPEGYPDPDLEVFPELERSSPGLVSDEQALESVSRWQEQIMELEAKGGPYAPGLDEPLADLARQRVNEGRLVDALSLYQRSLHVLRVNMGLASPDQMTIVRSMLQLQRAIGDRQALDGLYGYYYRLGWLTADAEDGASRWRVALEYLRWQRELLRAVPEGRRDLDRELLDLFQLNEDLLQQAESEGASPEIRRDLARSQLKNLYLVQSRVVPQIRQAPPGMSTRRNRRPDMLPEDIHQERLLGLQRSAVTIGSRLLIGLADQMPSAVDRAALFRDAGDWEQWNGGRSRAEEAWRRAYAILRDAGEDALISDWFGAPVELPDNGVFWQPDPNRQTSLVRINFGVTAQGRAIGATASLIVGRDSATILAMRELRAVRFRPRFDAGQAVAVEQTSRDYQVYHGR